jgi:hypothetical protein
MFSVCSYGVQSILLVAMVVHLQSAVVVPCVVHTEREIYNEQKRQVYTHQRIDGRGGCRRYVYRIYYMLCLLLMGFFHFLSKEKIRGRQALFTV